MPFLGASSFRRASDQQARSPRVLGLRSERCGSFDLRCGGVYTFVVVALLLLIMAPIVLTCPPVWAKSPQTVSNQDRPV